jgi:hypothetical protein
LHPNHFDGCAHGCTEHHSGTNGRTRNSRAHRCTNHSGTNGCTDNRGTNGRTRNSRAHTWTHHSGTNGRADNSRAHRCTHHSCANGFAYYSATNQYSVIFSQFASINCANIPTAFRESFHVTVKSSDKHTIYVAADHLPIDYTDNNSANYGSADRCTLYHPDYISDTCSYSCSLGTADLTAHIQSDRDASTNANNGDANKHTDRRAVSPTVTSTQCRADCASVSVANGCTDSSAN